MSRPFVCKWKTLTREELDDILDDVFAKFQAQLLILKVSDHEELS